MNVKVHHDKEQHQFRASIGKDEAYLNYREKGPDTLEYYETFVPERHREQGIASQIATEALNYAKKNNLHVIPSCSFVEHIITRNKEFEEIKATA